MHIKIRSQSYHLFSPVYKKNYTTFISYIFYLDIYVKCLNFEFLTSHLSSLKNLLQSKFREFFIPKEFSSTFAEQWQKLQT